MLLRPQLPLQPQAMALGGHQLLHLPQLLLHLKVFIFYSTSACNDVSEAQLSKVLTAGSSSVTQLLY